MAEKTPDGSQADNKLMIESHYRGHATRFVAGVWVYADTGEIVTDNRRCGNCHMENREDGHDACLGKLAGVMNACCGHGETERAYIQFWNQYCIRGERALHIGALGGWQL